MHCTLQLVFPINLDRLWNEQVEFWKWEMAIDYVDVASIYS